ncbi:hypothetical protein H2204_006800 [Knufia peltigerae]|uniref:Major facilitator superfamily (MFS) profile domain-containing protein n=1 Tax=Knufia peltigerae TaxID=1002370 RepID=A0AA39CYJ3_9EURO|nr:hypothetical protein H2204_006800 [Knufia peltigerae]
MESEQVDHLATSAIPTDSTATTIPKHDGTLKNFFHVDKLDHNSDTVETANMVYDNVDEEPELHARTYVAVGAIFILYLVQVMALQGPPAVVIRLLTSSKRTIIRTKNEKLSYIGKDLDGATAETWVSNSLNLVQVVLCPVLSSVADTFQVRKTLIVGSNVVSFIGAAIAPGSKDIYRLIAAQTLIGFGFATVPLIYCIPSEILPRKWRPMAQSIVNIGACLGAVAGPLSIGALVKADQKSGWRKFYWIEMGLFGLGTIGVLVGYRPPKRHTRYDGLSLGQKIARLDILGSFLLTVGLTLLLTGLNLGGGLYKWTNARVLATLIIGIVGLIAFGVYEWKGTSTGILHHGLFKGERHAGRTFSILIGLIAVEGLLLFAFVIFYPTLTTVLFETDPLLLTARGNPFWVACGLSTVFWGYIATKFRTIRVPLFFGFFIFTAGIVGIATTQPNTSTNLVIFAGLTGIGFGAPLILVIAGVQLCSPHDLFVTATAVMTSARGVGASIFIAIYAAALDNRLETKIPAYVAKAALTAGLPVASVQLFVDALAGGDNAGLTKIPGVTSPIVAAGVAALKQAYADSLRVVYMIAAPFGAVACIACLFIMDFKKTMNYRVDAPVENLHAKVHMSSHEEMEIAN